MSLLWEEHPLAFQDCTYVTDFISFRYMNNMYLP